MVAKIARMQIAGQHHGQTDNHQKKQQHDVDQVFDDEGSSWSGSRAS